tara:strand:- start:69 stop:347 length:279 start_codon:yes stop_codon:yes gene_type:complete
MIKLKEILLKEYLKPSSGKPEEGDYIRDGKIFGKIYKIDTWKGVKQVWIDPKGTGGFGKAVTGLSYDYKKLEISKKGGKEERNVGRPIWVAK